MGDYSEALRGQNENWRSMSARLDSSGGSGTDHRARRRIAPAVIVSIRGGAYGELVSIYIHSSGGFFSRDLNLFLLLDLS